MAEQHSQTADYVNRWKFTGHELDRETGLYYANARYYDPRTSIWLSVDKMATRAPQYSPYAYSFNNPVTFFDPDGNWPWPVHIRSFISASSVGPSGSFRGDGRGSSTQNYPDAWSRVRSSFTVDPSKGTVSKPTSQSDPTIFYGIGIIPGTEETPKPTSSISNITTYENLNAVSLDFHHSAKDPVTPGFATPDLDVHAYLDIVENIEAGMLSVVGIFTGDAFPSTEAFITDQGGNRLLLGAHKEQGGIGKLFGDNKRPTFNVNMIIDFDENGIFKGVSSGGKSYTTEQWNNKVQNDFNTQ